MHTNITLTPKMVSTMLPTQYSAFACVYVKAHNSCDISLMAANDVWFECKCNRQHFGIDI